MWELDLCKDAGMTFMQTLRRLLHRPSTAIADHGALQNFLDTRSTFIAQSALYGYLRTRAGMRHPQLFTDDVFVRSINIAKWRLWLACLGDVSVFAGGMLARSAGGSAEVAARTIGGVVERILGEKGLPADAGSEYSYDVQRLRSRIASCDWTTVGDDDSAFSDSPDALLRYAPIIDELKELDAPIVRNSVRFRWQDVRRDLRRNLDAPAVIASTIL
jgi:hypothetical protein